MDMHEATMTKHPHDEEDNERPSSLRRLSSRRRTLAIILAVVTGFAVVTGLAAVTVFDRDPDPQDRQGEIARRGALVMPFDLDRTTHIFEPRRWGGIQTVVADDHGDKDQTRLIREHLRAEAGAFAQGDFGDPAEIHGDEMPGLQELRANYESIALTFSDIRDGGRIIYRTDDPSVVTALHSWFEAQVTDHGSHAQH